MEVIRPKFVRVDGYAAAPVQHYRGDAGFDLTCVEDVTIEAQSIADLRTGIKAAIPQGHWGLITGRSSTFRKRRLLVLTGIIDSGFRGELLVCVYNANRNEISIPSGERLAQIIIMPLPGVVEWLEQASLPEGERGEAGFGSTGP